MMDERLNIERGAGHRRADPGRRGVIRRVIVPTVPDGVLSPNRSAKYGFHAKRRARAELQRAAWNPYLEAREENPLEGDLRVTARILWPPGARKKDLDNLGAMLKGCWDGFTDAAFWVDDRQMVALTVTQDRLDKAGRVSYPSGCVVVDVEQVSDDGEGR